MTYQEYIDSKAIEVKNFGFEVKDLNKTLFPHQKDVVRWSLIGGRRAIFCSFGLGKCHGIDTKILMHNGEIKKVQDVRVGDLLMGDDSQPRKVKSLANGREMMYKITLKNGDYYTCNESHILSLTVSNKYKNHKKGDIIDMELRDYLRLPYYVKNNCFKHYKNSVEFQEQNVPIDPYIFGMWIGDGHKRGLSFTINDRDSELVEKIYDFSESIGLKVRIAEGRGCHEYYVTHGKKANQYTGAIAERKYVINIGKKGKYIPKEYLINSSKNRLQLLAGILDTDGFLIDKCYEIVTKYIQLREDILYLCRSLGLSVTHRIKKVNGVDYYRIYISGNTDIIPCITRKKAESRNQIKNPLVYGFEIEELGIDEYFGFEIDGNRRYLLGDFTVTHNTVMQLEIAHKCIDHTNKPFLIGLPLGVLGEFKDDADLLGYHIHYCRDMQDVYLLDKPAICVSNYERIREGNFDPDYFGGVSFDEGDAIRNLDTKTSDYIIKQMSKVPLRFIATATPAPNEYTEILNYAEFLGIADRGQCLTRFFQRDSTKAGHLTLYPHKEKEFWIWVRTWAIFIEKPSDLSYPDDGYELPELKIHYHEVKEIDRGDIIDRDGNYKMYADASKGLSESAKEKRNSLDVRVEKAIEIIKNHEGLLDIEKSPDHLLDKWIIWHDLEDERKQIEASLPGVKSVFGQQKNELKEQLLNDFKHGKFQYLATKPTIAGSGCNFQKHCHNAVFVGIGYKFKDFIQAIHRILRFRQFHEVNIHLVFTDAETQILKALELKWKQHREMIAEMSALVKKYGLSQEHAISDLKRAATIERQEWKGKTWTYINNDAVLETRTMKDNSIDMILTSIPFGDHYEYCENTLDFGHNDGNEGFFRQMDYLTPELFRTLKPGRIAAIHVKNRIVFSYLNGVGFSTEDSFMEETALHFQKHGFYKLGMHVITTDVVRENNQTYRLGWTENSKDGTKMGAGLPEYLLIFRKPPTDSSKAYADEPVTKSKSKYGLGRWQLDAHSHWASSGNRLLTPAELRRYDAQKIGKWWKSYAEQNPYDFEMHEKLCEDLAAMGKLPKTFMLLPPKSKTDAVWDDVNRMATLNASQAKKRQEKHVCPAQFDVWDRSIVRYSNEGDLIFDPFGGIGTTPVRCIKLNRRSKVTELHTQYCKDGVTYCRETEYQKYSVPTLFDVLEKEQKSA